MSPEDAAVRFAKSLAAGGARDELTYDIDAFKSLREEEQAEATQDLLARAQGGDTRAVETLGFAPLPTLSQDVPTRDKLIEEVSSFAEGPLGAFRAASRRALLRLEPSDENIQSLRQDMIEYPAQVSSVYSTLLLKEMGASLEVHITNLRHPGDLTRHHSQAALVEHFGLEKVKENRFSRFRILIALNLLQLPSPLKEGAEGLESIFRTLAEGASPESLNLGHAPGTYADTLPGIIDILNAGEPRPPLPIEEMKRLDGQDAEWIRLVLFGRLLWEKSTRFLQALIEVKPRDWRIILEEELQMETERCAQGSDDDESDWLLELRAAIAELD